MKYELYKLWKNKIIWICIIVSMVLTLYMSGGWFDTYRNEFPDKLSDETLREISAYKGKFTEEKYRELKEVYDVYEAEFMLIHKINKGGSVSKEECMAEGVSWEKINSMTEEERLQAEDDFWYGWSEVWSETLWCNNSNVYRENVSKIAERLSKSPDKYTARLNTKIAEMYSKPVNYRVKDSIAKDMIENWKWVEYADYINIICIIIMISAVFLVEHRSNTFGMIYSSCKGRRRVYFNKAAVVVLISMFLGLMTSFLQVIMAVRLDLFGDTLMLDVQNVEVFCNSPYCINFLKLWIFIGLLRILGYAAVAAFMIFVTQFFKKNILPFCTGVLICCGGYGVISDMLDKIKKLEMVGRTTVDLRGNYNLVRKFTPFGLIRDGISYFTDYEPNNVFGMPVSTLSIAIAVNVVYIILFIACGYAVYKYRFRRKGI